MRKALVYATRVVGKSRSRFGAEVDGCDENLAVCAPCLSVVGWSDQTEEPVRSDRRLSGSRTNSGGSVRSRRAGFAGIGSNNPDAAAATCGRYRGRHPDIRDRRPALRGDSRHAAGARHFGQAANFLTRLELGRLELALAISAAPQVHTGVVSPYGFPESTTPTDLEAAVE